MSLCKTQNMFQMCIFELTNALTECYTITVVKATTQEYHKKEEKAMSGRQKKSRKKDRNALEAIVFLTAVLNLVEALIDLIEKFIE